MTFLLSFLNILGILFIYINNYKLVEGLNRLDVTKCLNLHYFLLFLVLFIFLKLVLITKFNIKWKISDLKHIFVPNYFQKTKLPLVNKIVSIIGLLFDLSIFAGVGFIFLKILLIEIRMSLDGTIPLLGFFKYLFPSDQQWFIYKIYTVESKKTFLTELINNWHEINKFTLKTLNIEHVHLTNDEINKLLELDSLKAIKITFIELMDFKMLSYENYNNDFYSKFLNLTGIEFSHFVGYSILALAITGCIIGFYLHYTWEKSYKKIAEDRQILLDKKSDDLNRSVREIDRHLGTASRNTSALLEGGRLNKRCIDHNSENIRILYRHMLGIQDNVRDYFAGTRRQREGDILTRNTLLNEQQAWVESVYEKLELLEKKLLFLEDPEELKIVKKEIKGLIKVSKIIEKSKKETTISEMISEIILEAIKEDK